MSVATPVRNSTLPALTGARFFAALAIVIWHYGREAVTEVSPRLGQLTSAGPIGVSFFFVLSGAVVTWGCTARDGSPSRPRKLFLKQRAARLLPAYLLALFVSMPLFVVEVLRLHSGSGAFARVGLGFVACFTLLQAFLPPAASGLNTPGWSISCEAFFYAIWPFAVRRLRPTRPGFPWRALVALGLVAAAIPVFALAAFRSGLIPDGPFPTLLGDVVGREYVARLVTYFPIFRLVEFLFGVVIGHALLRNVNHFRSLVVDSVHECLVLGVIVVVAYQLGGGIIGRSTGLSGGNRLVIESGILAPLFGVLIWTLARGRGLVMRFLSLPVVLVLGEASYAMYILQEPAAVGLSAVLKRVAPSMEGRWDVLFWPYLLVLIAVSIGVHRWVEQPIRGVLLRRWSRPKAVEPVVSTV